MRCDALPLILIECSYQGIALGGQQRGISLYLILTFGRVLIPISAESGKYIKHYSSNGKYVPEYFVFGELAGYPNPLIRNGAAMQRYLRPGYDAMIVAYKGRGEEDFYEEIDEIIEWMSLRSPRTSYASADDRFIMHAVGRPVLLVVGTSRFETGGQHKSIPLGGRRSITSGRDQGYDHRGWRDLDHQGSG